MCPVCKGRGEVEAGLTYGNGHNATHVVPNPAAMINGQVWILQENPLVPLWGIAVCARCRGTGAV